jgi:ADP-ribose pyrophosphatase YjhB (NUDIX family)
MKVFSAGILFIYNNKLLLAHPTGNSWYGTYGYPKGRLDAGETPWDAALRETEEEIGIKAPVNLLSKAPHELNYTIKKKGTKIYKTSYYFICKINDLSEIGLDKEVVPKNQLQLDEIDWAGFVDYKEAKKRLGKVFQPLLKHYNTNEADIFQFPAAVPVVQDLKYIKTFEEFMDEFENNKQE